MIFASPLDDLNTVIYAGFAMLLCLVVGRALWGAPRDGRG